ncbi:hypothetical protein Rs2_28189 [Raphanus sativus]|nr:hypothetical protein Rs2_28189 [Raphanus sativus]
MKKVVTAGIDQSVKEIKLLGDRMEAMEKIINKKDIDHKSSNVFRSFQEIFCKSVDLFNVDNNTTSFQSVVWMSSNVFIESSEVVMKSSHVANNSYTDLVRCKKVFVAMRDVVQRETFYRSVDLFNVDTSTTSFQSVVWKSSNVVIESSEVVMKSSHTTASSFEPVRVCSFPVVSN